VGPIVGSPVSYDNKLFVFGSNGQVKCIDLTSKQELWNFSLHSVNSIKKRIIGGGLSFDLSGSLYITSSLGDLVSISLESGNLNWRFKSDAPILDRPTIVNKRIFFTDTSGVSRSFSSNGELNWSVEGQASEHIRSKIGRPIAFGNLLLLPSSGGVLNAVDVRDGSKMWSFDFTGQRLGYAQNIFGSFNGEPGVFGENIYYGSVIGQFNALNRFGESIWQAEVGLQGSPIAVSNSIFFISDRNELVRLDKNNGDRIWATIVTNLSSSEHYFTPILAGSKLWLTGTDNFLRSFDVETGLLIDKIIIKSGSTGPPIYYSGSIIVYTESGELIAFR
jgi:outer membrane protein assembly factor BamB